MRAYVLSSGGLLAVKNKRIFQTFSSKVVTVAYERWPLTRGSKYGDLISEQIKDGTWELLVVWNDLWLRRVGRKKKFNCSIIRIIAIKSKQPEFLDYNIIFST